MSLAVEILISSSTPASESAMIGQVKDLIMGHGYILDVSEHMPSAEILSELSEIEQGRAAIKTYTS